MDEKGRVKSVQNKRQKWRKRNERGNEAKEEA
jgi:hypothetical protein